jgi:sugar lactone lactonase YvrE
VALLALAGLGLVLSSAVAHQASQRERWDTRLFARIPSPGFPARAYVAPNRRVYEGTYDNPSGDSVPSRVFEYTARGALLRSWTIKGQRLSSPHGVQVATSDARGRLVLLDKTPARILLLNPRTGRQRTYAKFKDLPACKATECSPNLLDDPPTANYAAWGPDGSLYVTDYLEAVIWRVPPGGGNARVWLADNRLDGTEFGATGIVLGADRRTLYVGMQSEGGLGAGDPTTGRIWTIPIKRNGKPGGLHQLWESEPIDGPDGFGISRSGRIYITLTVANQIAVISSQGEELERFPASSGGGANGSPIPFDNPSSAWFAGRRLMVANQSFIAGDPTHMAILDVFTGERGLRELIPKRAGFRRR